MKRKTKLDSMPLFWKVYVVIVSVLILVVALAEFILEPIAERMFEGIYGGFQPWYEVVIWLVSILVPSLLCGYILTQFLSAKLNKMVKVSKSLAHGNLNARMPVTGNDRDDFDLLAQSFNEMANAVVVQLHNERRLLADISHELRSPLTRMTIATELLRRRDDAAERNSVMLRLEKELEQMGELVSLLLTQARDRFSASDLAGSVDFSKILNELADDFAFQGEVQKKGVQKHIEGGLTVSGNPVLLQRMLGNILSNAIFYTPADSNVCISATHTGKEITIAIRDYGSGVPEDQLEDIFRAFYRVDSSRARFSGGVGLGLALAREAAIHHGGSITASNARPGLQISIILPVDDVHGK